MNIVRTYFLAARLCLQEIQLSQGQSSMFLRESQSWSLWITRCTMGLPCWLFELFKVLRCLEKFYYTFRAVLQEELLQEMHLLLALIHGRIHLDCRIQLGKWIEMRFLKSTINLEWIWIPMKILRESSYLKQQWLKEKTLFLKNLRKVIRINE